MLEEVKDSETAHLTQNPINNEEGRRLVPEAEPEEAARDYIYSATNQNTSRDDGYEADEEYEKSEGEREEEKELKGEGSKEPRLSKFIKKLETELASNEQQFGSNSIELVPPLSQLSEAYEKLEDYAKQIEILERVLKILQNACSQGENQNEEIASVLKKLSKANAKLGEHSTRFRLLGEALDIQQACFEPNHPELAVTFSEMALICRGMERPEAISYAQRAYSIATQNPTYIPAQKCVRDLITGFGLENLQTKFFSAAAKEGEEIQQQIQQNLVKEVMNLFSIIKHHADLLGLEDPTSFVINTVMAIASARRGDLDQSIFEMLETVTNGRSGKCITALNQLYFHTDFAHIIINYLVEHGIERLHEHFGMTQPSHSSVSVKFSKKNKQSAASHAKENLDCFVKKQMDALASAFDTNPNVWRNVYEGVKYLNDILVNPDYEQVIQTLINVGDAYGEVEKFDEQRKCLDHALAIATEVFMHNNPQKYKALFALLLGKIERFAGKLEAFLVKYRTSLKEEEKIQVQSTTPDTDSSTSSTSSTLSSFSSSGQLTQLLSQQGSTLQEKVEQEQKHLALSVIGLFDALKKEQEKYGYQSLNCGHFVSTAVLSLAISVGNDGENKDAFLMSALKNDGIAEFWCDFIKQYINENPQMRKLREHFEFAYALSNELCDIEKLEELRERYGIPESDREIIVTGSESDDEKEGIQPPSSVAASLIRFSELFVSPKSGASLKDEKHFLRKALVELLHEVKRRAISYEISYIDILRTVFMCLAFESDGKISLVESLKSNQVPEDLAEFVQHHVSEKLVLNNLVFHSDIVNEFMNSLYSEQESSAIEREFMDEESGVPEMEAVSQYSWQNHL
jgi:tetratricopeptide (TPR) repeat protein